MLLPALNQAREKAKSIKCVNTLKNAGLFFAIYADTYNGFIPAINYNIGKSWTNWAPTMVRNLPFRARGAAERSFSPIAHWVACIAIIIPGRQAVRGRTSPLRVSRRFCKAWLMQDATTGTS